MKLEKKEIAADIGANINEVSKALAVLRDHRVLTYAFLITNERLAQQTEIRCDSSSYLFGAQACLENLEEVVTIIENTRR